MKKYIDKTKKYIDPIKDNKLAQGSLLASYILITTLSLYFSQKSVVAFLLILGSLLLLHFTKLGTNVKWVFAGLVLVVLLPLSASQGIAFQSYMEVATLVGIYVAMALGLNIVVGLAGLLDLGFVAFFAVGAYTYGIFATPQAANFLSFGTYPLGGESFWIFILIGGFVAALFGILLGVPVLRVKGDYLAIVTLGFGEIIRIVFNNLDRPVNITNGAMGLSSVTPPKLFGMSFIYPNQFYFIVLAILVIVLFIVKRLEYSKIGRSWKAVRENEIAAQSMGIHLVRTKLTAFAVGASFSGMMGVVFAAKQTFVDPTSFTLLESITILVMVILGGMGSVPGVILGAAIMTILNMQVLTELTNWLNQLNISGVISIPDALSPSKMQRFIFGAILILFALYRPQGLIPAKNPIFNAELLKKGRVSQDQKKQAEEVSVQKEGVNNVHFDS
jgi:branched-chain amino acid transport system permease protein